MEEERPLKRARLAGNALSERRAWEILSAVSGPLRGRIRLVSSGHEHRDLEVIHSYDWLELTIPSPEDHPKPQVWNACEWVEQAGEICVVWHLLSCCPGFRAHENSAFWKRVVDSLATTDGQRARTPSDGFRFFRMDGEKTSVFPRFLLKPPIFAGVEPDGEDEMMLREEQDEPLEGTAEWIDSVVAAFTRRVRIHNEDLCFYENELLEYVDLNLYLRADVPIGVRLVKNYPFEGLGGVFLDLSKQLATKNQTHGVVSALTHFPKTKLTSLIVDSRDEWDDVVELADILNSCSVQLAEFKSVLGDEIHTEDLRDFLLAASRGVVSKCSRVSFNLDEATSDQVETIFSVLPRLRIRSVRLTSSRSAFAGPTIDTEGWTWLAYALFHPWSTWRDLDMDSVDIFQPTAVPMKSVYHAQAAMYRLAHGNDDSSLTEALCGRYAVVQIQARTTYFDSSSLSGNPTGTIGNMKEETAVLPARVEDVDQLPAAVCIVIQGVGLAWIAREDVLSLQRLPVARSSVTHLRIGCWSRLGYSQLPSVLENFKAIRFLDLINCGPIDLPRLLPILRVTPQLNGLCLGDCGHVFTDWRDQTTQDDSALQNLRLRSVRLEESQHDSFTHSPSLAAWQTCLRDLREFVSVISVPSFDWHERIALEIIARGQSVEYLVWINRAGRDSRLSGYLPWRRSNRVFLDGFRPSAEFAQVPLSQDARIAFLSVVRRQQMRNRDPLGQLGQDVAQRIFAFVTTDVERHVWIDSYA